MTTINITDLDRHHELSPATDSRVPMSVESLYKAVWHSLLSSEDQGNSKGAWDPGVWDYYSTTPDEECCEVLLTGEVVEGTDIPEIVQHLGSAALETS